MWPFGHVPAVMQQGCEPGASGALDPDRRFPGGSPVGSGPVFIGRGGASPDGGGEHGPKVPGTGGRLNLLLSCAAWKQDPWSESLPRLLEPLGITSVRATTARQAERVIRSTPVHIAVVDLTLPLDERCVPGLAPEDGGARVLELLGRLAHPVPTVVVKTFRTSRDERRDLNAALRWGAFAVVDRAAADVEMMLQVMQRCLVRFYAGRWPQCERDLPGDAGGERGMWV
jgi:CheY-like chemotaxis protein